MVDIGSMKVLGVLRRAGGVTHYSAFVDAGISEHGFYSEVKAGRIQRVRRGWYALLDADPQLVEAAKLGVVITCVTQAERLRLWTLTDGKKHFATRTPGSRPITTLDTKSCKLHWTTPLYPRHPHLLTDPLINVLACVAKCQPFEKALTIWDSAINKKLITPTELGRLNMGAKGRRLLNCASQYPDSGLESIFSNRLRWLDVRIVPQAMVLGRRVDCLIGERLIVEIDGGHHVGPQRTRDIENDARATLHGYRTIRISYHQIMTDWPGVQKIIMTAIAQGLHLKSD